MNFFNYLKYEKNLLVKRTMPIYLIFFITERCLNDCRHCLLGNFNKTKKNKELSTEEIKKISGSLGDLLMFLPTGGEPFLREDLPEIVKIFYDNNHARNVGIPTSGFNPKKINNLTERILTACPKLDLGIEVSLDGFERTHNMIRNNKNSYANALKTLEMLQVLAGEHSNLNVSVALTFSKYNQDELLELYEYLKKIKRVTNFTLLLTRGAPSDKKAKEFNIEKFKAVKDKINRDLLLKKVGYKGYFFSKFINAKRIIRNDMVYEIYKSKKQQGPCYAGSLTGVIRADGSVYPCEMADSPLGNLRDENYNFEEIWFNKRANLFRENIRKNKCYCTHECFLSTNILFNPKYFAKLIYYALIRRKANNLR